MDNTKPILIVGLGNPGAEYAMTRHNVGFMVVDALAGAEAKWKSEHKSQVASRRGVWHTPGTTVNSQKIILAKPQTFMNLSGEAVRPLMKFYKIPLENLIVVHDDIDLKPGDIRDRVGCGSAGHHGIESIDAAVGRDYRRIRVGVGHPRDTGLPIDPSDWVLGKMSATEAKKITTAAVEKIQKVIVE